MIRRAFPVLALVALLGGPAESKPRQARDLPAFLGPLGAVPVPKDNPMSDAKVELGRMLYYDPRISGNGIVSCATCHHPGLGWADGLAKGVGIDGARLGRSSPSVLNAAYYETQFWDGRAPSLEEQAKGTLQNGKEMGATPQGCVERVKSVPGYVKRFQEVFEGEVTFDRVAMAIAAFERTVVDLDSPFDRWVRGNEEAMSEAQKRGLELFVGKARCATCHSGPLFADRRFHGIGIDDGDEGRMAVTRDPKDKGGFKTPTLRNAALTAPYMHAGSMKTLREVIDHYEKASNEKEKHPSMSIFMLPFKLNEEEKRDLEAFMHALTGDKRDPRAAVIPVLPQ